MVEAAIALAMIFLPDLEENLAKSPFQDIFRTPVHESAEKLSVSEEILSAAKRMVDLRTDYRFSFPTIDYPFGDVPSDWGLCCDGLKARQYP